MIQQSFESLPQPIIVWASSPAVQLSAGEARERARLARLPRVESWLRGRAALKLLLGSLDLDSDTSKLAFPHPRLSVAHSGDWAVAAGLRETTEVAGIGIDYERDRHLRAAAASLFLTSAERAVTDCADARLRLWTVKEALFKADSGNAERSLRDYIVDDAKAHSGTACCPAGSRFLYRSEHSRDGWLSIALRLQRSLVTLAAP